MELILFDFLDIVPSLDFVLKGCYLCLITTSVSLFVPFLFHHTHHPLNNKAFHRLVSPYKNLWTQTKRIMHRVDCLS